MSSRLSRRARPEPDFSAKEWVRTFMSDCPRGWKSHTRVPFLLECVASRNPEEALAFAIAHVTSEKPPLVIDTDGGIPWVAAQVRPTFLRTLRDSLTRVNLATRLTQLLDETALKRYWPDLWLARHNAIARKQVRREIAQHKPLGPRKNPYVSESIRSAAKRSIS